MPSKYDGLRDHLLALDDPAVEMSFAKIARLVDGGLPASADKYTAWWSNEEEGGHIQKQAWLDAGRRTSGVDLNAQRVRFTR